MANKPALVADILTRTAALDGSQGLDELFQLAMGNALAHKPLDAVITRLDALALPADLATVIKQLLAQYAQSADGFSRNPMLYTARYATVDAVQLTQLATNYVSNGANFWAAYNQFGAYIEPSSISTWTTVCTVNNGGYLANLLGPTFAPGVGTMDWEITLDGVVYELLNLYADGGRTALQWADRTIEYGSAPVGNVLTGQSIKLQPPQVAMLDRRALRFDRSLQVRVRSAKTLNGGTYHNRIGASFVTDNA